jgi:acyl-CoA reductase-like NAD-dependent aldehyde dehydrogenase
MAAAPKPRSTEPRLLDETVARVRDGARAWARLPISGKIALARSLRAGSAQVAERSVAAACAAKGIPEGSPLAGEEWLGGPYVNLRMLRQLIGSLLRIERHGNTKVGPLGETIDGRLTVRVFPASRLDALLFMGVRADVHLEAGVTEEKLHATRASLYRQPAGPGRVSLVLGAGNVNSIPSTDVLTKLFVEGKTCVLKMNPVNAYVGPFIEEAFAGAIARGFLAVVYGGADEGAYLTRHPGIDEIHITGSDKTHDLLVWGPPGPERAERMARHRPLLDKEISSELGNVTPVLVVPGPYSDKQLAWQAESVAGMVTHNASFNCIAGKLLVTPKGWKQREKFLDLLAQSLDQVPARKAWYPGAEQRYRSLTEGRPHLRQVGRGGEGTLPWALVTDLEAADGSERAFTTEPFCAIISETSVGSADPVEFLAEAVSFSNRQVWGTLAAALVVHPATLADLRTGAAVEKAVRDLRYGTVTLNTWPGMSFAMGTTPWGAAPGSPLTDIQSGRGFVHNTLMLEGVEKVVMRHPVTSPIKLPYFPSHRTADVLGRRLTALEQGGSLLELPGVVAAALRG